MINPKPDRPLLGVGSCLVGHAVQYDGQTKPPNPTIQALCSVFDTRTFCPEVGIGLGVPRPPIHLVGTAQAVRVVDVATHQNDYTHPIRDYAAQVLRQAPDMVGYVLVKASPSCGYGNVKRYSEAGRLQASDQDGIFAAELARLDPLLALEDDSRLNDPRLREGFVARANAYHAWKQLLNGGLNLQALQAYWSRHKHLVMAHDLPGARDLDGLLADRRQPLDTLAEAAITRVMAALRKPATRRSHSHVLRYLAGQLGRRMSSQQRRRLAAAIDHYRTGQAPLGEPITLLRCHVADRRDAYISGQGFMEHNPDATTQRVPAVAAGGQPSR